MPQSIAEALQGFANSINVAPSGNAPDQGKKQPIKGTQPPNASGVYLLTSTRFTGAVVFEFDAEGYLIRYDIKGAELSDEQKVFILQKLPKSIGAIKAVLGQSKDAKLTKQKATGVTFEMFWHLANDKDRSSKKKSLAWWNRSNQTQRDAAYNYWPTYIKNIPPGIARKYVESYLNAELWNN